MWVVGVDFYVDCEVRMLISVGLWGLWVMYSGMVGDRVKFVIFYMFFMGFCKGNLDGFGVGFIGKLG